MVVLAVVVVVSGALVVVTGLHVMGGCHGVVGLGVALCVVYHSIKKWVEILSIRYV